MTAAEEDDRVNASLVHLDKVRVRNFRSLRSIDVDLGSLTVLVGENNSGKTNFMQALVFALSASPQSLEVDDVHCGSDSDAGIKSKKVIIDCRVIPTDDKGERQNDFEDFWLTIWGEGVQQDDLDRDFVGIRTIAAWDATRGAFHSERYFLREWPERPDDVESARVGSSVARKQMEPISIDSMDAQRDIESDFSRKSSFWRRLVDEHGIPDEEIRAIESQLALIRH